LICVILEVVYIERMGESEVCVLCSVC